MNRRRQFFSTIGLGFLLVGGAAAAPREEFAAAAKPHRTLPPTAPEHRPEFSTLGSPRWLLILFVVGLLYCRQYPGGSDRKKGSDHLGRVMARAAGPGGSPPSALLFLHRAFVHPVFAGASLCPSAAPRAAPRHP